MTKFDHFVLSKKACYKTVTGAVTRKGRMGLKSAPVHRATDEGGRKTQTTYAYTSGLTYVATIGNNDNHNKKATLVFQTIRSAAFGQH